MQNACKVENFFVESLSQLLVIASKGLTMLIICSSAHDRFRLNFH
jgi:hypothetical protein